MTAAFRWVLYELVPLGDNTPEVTTVKERNTATPDPDRFYETYVKPLEQGHKDEYVLEQRSKLCAFFPGCI